MRVPHKQHGISTDVKVVGCILLVEIVVVAAEVVESEHEREGSCVTSILAGAFDFG